MLLLAIAMLQGTTPAVGDTVWVKRALTAAPGTSVRPRPIVASASVEPLGPPEVVSSGRAITIRYAVVLWRPGEHRIEMPPVIVVRNDGFSDTLPASVATVTVRSVLPADAKPDTLSPAPPIDVVLRRTPSALPVIVLLLLAALLLVPAHLWWRRRGRPEPPVPAKAPARIGPADIAQWMEAGELHAAADAWAGILAPRLSEAHDPVLEGLVQRLGAARYGAVDHEELTALCRDAARAAGG